MAQRVTLSETHDGLPFDSGYMSDVPDAPDAPLRKAKPSIFTLDPSLSAHGLDITTVAFDDTNWESSSNNKPNTSLKVKQPKGFPIIPLESTMARARLEAKVKLETKATAKVNERGGASSRFKKRRAPVKGKAVVVDGRGRTRAARKALFAESAEAGLALADFKFEEGSAVGIKEEKQSDHGGVLAFDAEMN